MIGLAVLVLFARAVVVYRLGQHPLLDPANDPTLDPGAYLALARRVIAGDIGLGPGLYYVSPLYVYFLAAVLSVAHSLEAARIVQIALGVASIGFIFGTAREWFGRRAAWIAAALSALCGATMFYDAVMMQSALDVPLTSAALFATTLALTRSRLQWSAAAGLLFGLEALNRPNILPAIALVVIAAALARRWRVAVAMAAGTTVVLGAVLVRNVTVSDTWSALPSHGGLNLVIGNNANATGMYQAVPGIRPDIEGQQQDTRRVAERAVGRPLSDAEVSQFFTDEARHWIASAPGPALRLYAWKVYLVFHADHLPLPYSYDFFAFDVASGLKWFPVGFWLLAPLGLTGLVLIRPSAQTQAYWIWALFVPAYGRRRAGRRRELARGLERRTGGRPPPHGAAVGERAPIRGGRALGRAEPAIGCRAAAGARVHRVCIP